MNTILIIDDEPQIRRLLRMVLETANYKVVECACGEEGLIEAAMRPPSALILDLGLPDLPGIDVLRRLRQWSSVPVLILSAKDHGEEKAEALDEGADDYVTKPFNTAELLARLRVILRRVHLADEPVFESGLLKIDIPAQAVWIAGKKVDFTATEFSLLRTLARHVGKVITHKHLLTTVWGPNSTDQSQYLRVYLSHIRKKLTAAGLPPNTIRTEAGIGYRLEAP